MLNDMAPMAVLLLRMSVTVKATYGDDAIAMDMTMRLTMNPMIPMMTAAMGCNHGR